MKEVVMIDAARTPIGKYRGSLSPFTAVELGTLVTKGLLDKTKLKKDKIDQVIFGNVLQAGNGQNVARQIALNSGLPVDVPAMTINEVCGSGMKAVILARQLIQLGEAELVIAGGTESMSQAPMLKQYQSETNEYGEPISSMVNDGLTDAFSNAHMGLTAEKVATQFSVSREEQDRYALSSQLKAAHAVEAGVFSEEIIPVKISDEDVLSEDEAVRGNSTLEKLGTLRTVFSEEGTVTAGNASPLNDGASVVILASKEYAENNNLPYLATIKEVAEVGIDPGIMGIAPIKAIQKLTDRSGMNLSTIDLFEINEAFAASSIVVSQELQLDEEKVNIYGGAIALGHPIGASGARILTTLAYGLLREQKRYGIASLCIGGGLGLAVLLEANMEQTHKDVQKKKFYQLTPSERRSQLIEKNVFTQETALIFQEQTLSEELSDHMIENQVSEVEIPMGIAQNFQINGKKKWIPMATEEPSVIAAASNGAKICGNICAETPQRLMRGQIVLSGKSEYQAVINAVNHRKEELILCANESYPSIVKRGGGVQDISTREFMGSFHAYLSIDFLVDVKDAMGANMINSILESVANKLREWFPEEEILFSILSNFATESLASACCEIPFERLGRNKEIGEQIAKKIQQAGEYAKLDPYRAATHNKGIMNGIEAVVAATGNDTRAVSASIHAYAARNGLYQGLTDWQIKGDKLVGKLTVPLAVATVGGASNILPKAKASLAMLDIDSAKELAQVIAAVGLAQNLAALRALVTEGIQKGHMGLQARSLAISIGAIGEEIEQVAKKLREAEKMNQQTAIQILEKIREK
ncbi:hydroxymethylglutaryl-CoA reductase, degradative [Enterococcus faecium]|uniref:hydroxymethylglutaryl-CoA reductase, degradative n=1 Tax=Enterococcus faecium TaxID=1352 RepID=UPI001144FACB|nr:hydroxymethylglutaryl-CoA reductase, degradative [Enterococcus faecium]EGW0194457.1 hydroxymethylglutaryl-CoA reductase, degradative [Enterococcus faecium]NTR83089.1 hydroxymethylglutaryl-CoA reductase, degradative [Enterococcus faecium]TQB34701.1 hydroxymethylglutaryl-CoA reductase, degradative [Enterococcus faecium]